MTDPNGEGGPADAADAFGGAGEWQRLSPLTIAAHLLRAVSSMVLPLGFVLFGLGSDAKLGHLSAAMLGILPLVVIAVIAGMTALAWYRQRYRVGASDVRYEHGLISRSARSVPFERIQDVSLEQKLIPRLLGLVEVRFETGAGGKDELKLDFVTLAEGERLRETVRARTETEEARETGGYSEIDAAGGHAGAGAGAGAGARAPGSAVRTDVQTLFAMDDKRLTTFGLFEFSLVVFAVLFGFAQQFEFLLPFELFDLTFWKGQLAGQGEWLSGLTTLVQIGSLVGGLAMIFVVGVFTGVVRTVLRDFGFRLDKTAKGFRRRRGLLTKTDVVMPIHRVQALTVSTGVVRRLWGWHGLAFISLAQDAKSANHDVAPFAQMAEITPIAEAAHFHLPAADTDWHRAAPRYYADRALVGALVPGIGAAVALGLGQSLAGLALAALGAVSVVRQYWLWRNDRHALDSTQVLSRKGWLVPKLLIASRVKLHSAEIAQGPIARWRGYAHLKFGLAGGRLSFRGLPLAEAQKMRAAALNSIAAVDFAQLPR